MDLSVVIPTRDKASLLARTLAAVHKERLRAGLLPTLPTLAGPGDLIHAAPLMMEQSVSNQTG